MHYADPKRKSPKVIVYKAKCPVCGVKMATATEYFLHTLSRHMRSIFLFDEHYPEHIQV
mgnify:CR=1 FL=1